VNAPSWSGITPPLWCIYSDTSRLLVAVSGTSINLYPRVSRSAYRIEDFRNEPARGRKAVLLGKRRPGQSRRKLHAARLDVRVGMLFPKLGVCAIIVTTASTPHAYGRHDLNDVADAAKVLEPAVGRGRWAGALFALGVIGLGIPAIPVFAGSGPDGLLGKRSGFSRLPGKAPVFYGRAARGTIGGAAVTLTHIDSVQFFLISAFINGHCHRTVPRAGHAWLRQLQTCGRPRQRLPALTLGWLTAAIIAVAAAVSLTLG
jgi:hypothetical protein